MSVPSRARALGHATHPMLIVVPLGMFTGAVVFDGVHYFRGREPQWAIMSYWMIVTGLVGGMVAAVPGWVDWFAIPSGTRAKTVGLVHGLGNGIGVLGLFGASWYFRRPEPGAPPDLALLLSLIGFALGGVTAWLGGELVERLGVGVDSGAHPDAPNSLTNRSATKSA
ncbi:MAG TPA: DUF2231 domain-containing protein [Gemmata sp.]